MTFYDTVLLVVLCMIAFVLSVLVVTVVDHEVKRRRDARERENE